MEKSARIMILVPEAYCITLLAPLVDALKSKASVQMLVATEWNWSDFFFAPIDAFNPTAILIWNGLAEQTISATRVLSKRYNTAVLEMGWLPQKGHMYCLDAVAGLSKLASVRYEEVPHDKEALASLRELYKPEPIVGLPERFVFVPMQLEYDTVIKELSPDHKLMNKFLAYVVNATRLPVVVKNHPKDSRAERIKGCIMVASSVPAKDIASQATMVVGINSTVLTEALIHYKPVVYHGSTVAKEAMWDGRAFYGTSLDRILELPQYAQDEIDFRLSLLLRNQYDYANPPGWVIDKILAGDFGPRMFDS